MVRRSFSFLGAAYVLCAYAVAVPVDQVPLAASQAGSESPPARETRPDHPLQGRFLQISDLHPDPFYKPYSSPASDSACHRGKGSAGIYGAETTSCDSPFSLINETFDFIDKHIKDKIDFVIWTGDSARHDNDERHPRSVKQVQDLNQLCVDKFREVFGTSDSPSDGFSIPIVPTLGNNDILPHNILPAAPNRWTRSFLSIWRPFVPEPQRHTFESGGWFTVEVIPNRLVVFSVNSLYFYASNAAVDGCIDRGEPGYKQFEWLRVQLQLVRDRGMKAILTGHVPPARTREKETWDEGCWQKYALWVQRYRDVLVGSVWGHMNIDHFMLQDSDEVDLDGLEEGSAASVRAAMEGDAGTESTADYLAELREIWAELPKMVGRPSLEGDARGVEEAKTGRKHRKGGKDEKDKKSKKDKYHDEIGGPFGERFSVSLVSPSVVPNYYPTLRVIEYNVSGIDSTVAHPPTPSTASTEDGTWLQQLTELLYSIRPAASKKKRKHFTAPKGPSKSTPPGPAYSPQPLTWTKYTQLYANLTAISHSQSQQSPPHPPAPVSQAANSMSDQTRRTAAAAPANFSFVVEYDTQQDPVYRMPDLTVRSWLELAGRIGRAEEAVALDSEQEGDGGEREAADERYGDDEEEKGKGGKKGKKGKKGKTLPNTAWRVFLDRAFVGSKSAEELEGRFGRGVAS